MRERFFYGGMTALLSVLGLMVPMLLYLAPIPLGVLTYRQGMPVGTAAAVASGVVTGIFINEVGLLLVILLLALGLTLGGGLREGMKPGPLLALGTVVLLIVFAALFYTAQRVLAVNLIDEMFGQWQSFFGPDFDEMLSDIRTVFPAMTAMSALMITFVNMFGIHTVLRRQGEQSLWFRPFRYWRLPVGFALAYVIMELAAFFVDAGVFGNVVRNIQAILVYLFIIHGLAVVTYFCQQWGFHWAVLAIIYTFVLLTPFGHTLLVLLGVVDAVVNLRRLDGPARLE